MKTFLLFFVFGLLLYFNSLNNQFLIDDYGFLNNPVFSNVKFIASQWNPFREQVLGVMDTGQNLAYYRPLAHEELDICYAVFKNHYWEYHLLNLALLVTASFLIYLFINKLTGNYHLAFLTGFFYLIHPVNGIIVNYISAGVFAFQVLCTLGSILLLLGSIQRGKNRPLYYLSLVLCILSLFWHESGIMTPFYAATLILIFMKDTLKEKILYLLPYFLIDFVYFVFRLNFLRVNELISGNMSHYHMTAGQYAASLFQIYAWYISKLFFPQGIVMQWASPVIYHHLLINILGFCLLFLFFFLLFVRFSKDQISLLAISWLVIGFLPVSLAAFAKPGDGAQIEPHWFVFSSIGFFILAAHFGSVLLDRMKAAGPVLLFLIVFFWGSISFANNQLWADQKTYALYWLGQAPGLKSANLYLADAYQREGAFNESRKYYRLALSGHLTDADVYNNLGFIDQSEGHFKDAEANYRTALNINPYSANTYNNLGSAYYAQGRLQEAGNNFQRSLIFNPLLLDPRRGLAFIALRHSQYPKAVQLCLENLDIKRDDARTLLLLITILIKEKDSIDLKKYTHRFIGFETDPVLLTGLGVVLSQDHDFGLARECFQKAIRVDPDYRYAYLEELKNDKKH